MRTVLRALAVTVAGAAILAGPGASTSGAQEADARRCAIIKLRALVKEVKDKAQCWERSLKDESPVDSDCMSKAEMRRDRLFARAEERGGCTTTKDGPSYGSRIDSFVAELSRMLSLAPAAPSPAPSPAASPAASPEGSAGAKEGSAESAASPAPKGSPGAGAAGAASDGAKGSAADAKPGS